MSCRGRIRKKSPFTNPGSMVSKESFKTQQTEQTRLKQLQAHQPPTHHRIFKFKLWCFPRLAVAP